MSESLHRSNDHSTKETALYQELAPGCIRLLHLRGTCLVDVPRSRGQQDFAIVCSFEVVSIRAIQEQERSYAALSYCWGHRPSHNPPLALCDGHLVSLTSNLSNALKTLLFSAHWQTSALWVDSLCINQADEREKAVQVGLMAAIYTQAAVVLVWPADGDDWPAGAGDWSDASAERFWRTLGNADSDATDAADANTNADANDTDAASAADRRLRADVDAFIARCAWMQRCWTLQEIVLARHAVVLFRQHAVGWDALSRAFGHHAGIAGIEALRAAGGSDSLAELLSASAGRACSVAHDRVYSLLGLYRGPLAITVDYERRAAETFAQLALALVRELGHTTFVPEVYVTQAYGDARQPVGKSWLPDWRTYGQEDVELVTGLGSGLESGSGSGPVSCSGLVSGSGSGTIVARYLPAGDGGIDVRLDGSDLLVGGVLLGVYVSDDIGPRSECEWTTAGDIHVERVLPFPPCIVKAQERVGKAPRSQTLEMVYRQLRRHDRDRCICRHLRRNTILKICSSDVRFMDVGEEEPRYLWLAAISGSAALLYLNVVWAKETASVTVSIDRKKHLTDPELPEPAEGGSRWFLDVVKDSYIPTKFRFAGRLADETK